MEIEINEAEAILREQLEKENEQLLARYERNKKVLEALGVPFEASPSTKPTNAKPNVKVEDDWNWLTYSDIKPFVPVGIKNAKSYRLIAGDIVRAKEITHYNKSQLWEVVKRLLERQGIWKIENFAQPKYYFATKEDEPEEQDVNQEPSNETEEAAKE